MIQYPKFKVCVRCFTFNQSKYIIDALDGFCMQQTDFPFICCVVDDASTDGEQEVINKYLEDQFDFSDFGVAYKKETDYAYITYAQHKINHNCYFAVLLLKENLYAKNEGYKKMGFISEWRDLCEYEAVCEGDDYWTDSLKIQKQIEWMDNNPNYTLCFHSAKIISEFPNPGYLCCESIEDRDYSSDELLEQWIAPTASFLYKLDVAYYQIKNSKRILNGDIFIVLKSGALGKIRGMKESMSCYRIHNGGITYNKKEKTKRILRYPDHFECIKENFPNVASLYIKKSLMRAYYNRAHCQSSAKLKIKDYWKSFCTSPIEFTILITKVIFK